jgi:hypothetical protein
MILLIFNAALNPYLELLLLHLDYPIRLYN